MIICLFLSSTTVQASWVWEIAVWNSPHGQQQIFSTELCRAWKFRRFWRAELAAAGQFTRPGPGQGEDLFQPRASLLYRPSLREATHGKFSLTYHPKVSRWELAAGLEVMADPLLLSAALQGNNREAGLNLGLVFAANERWALGAHLHYTRNSLYTFQVHHSKAQNTIQTISYSRSLDGSLQRLGLKLTF